MFRGEFGAQFRKAWKMGFRCPLHSSGAVCSGSPTPSFWRPGSWASGLSGPCTFEAVGPMAGDVRLSPLLKELFVTIGQWLESMRREHPKVRLRSAKKSTPKLWAHILSFGISSESLDAAHRSRRWKVWCACPHLGAVSASAASPRTPERS